MERCLFPARFGIFVFVVNMINVNFPISTLTGRVNNYVSRQVEVVKRRIEFTIIIINIIL